MRGVTTGTARMSASATRGGMGRGRATAGMGVMMIVSRESGRDGKQGAERRKKE